VLQIGDQFFTQTKALWTVGGKQPPNYLDYIGARSIETNYHAIEFIGVNDFAEREVVDVAITSADFAILQNNNYATINGVDCELVRVEFYDYNNRAKVTYKEPLHWAYNVKKIVVND
jgi:hypothetical protein